MMKISGSINQRNEVYITSEISEDTLPKKETVLMHLIPTSRFMFSPEEYPQFWDFEADGDAEWFDADRAEKIFREKACSWYKEHVLIGASVDEIDKGFYYLIDSKVGTIKGNAIVVLERTDVHVLGGDAYAAEIIDSNINSLCCHAKVGVLSGSSYVKTMYGEALIHDMTDTARIHLAGDNAEIVMMSGKSMVSTMEDHAGVICMKDDAKVVKTADDSVADWLAMLLTSIEATA